MKVCSVDGCERKKAAKGLCLMHYKRVKYHGSLERSKWGIRKKCELCDKDAMGQNMCRMHYYYWKKYGDPLYIEHLSPTYIDSNGYIVTRGDKKGVPLHRYLTNAQPFQCVHHINGIKTDNRLENLHVFDTGTEHLSCHNSLEQVAMKLVESGVIGFDRDTGRYFLK